MEERKRDWKEVERVLSDVELKEQTSRCMNCGQPFCRSDTVIFGIRIGIFL